MSEQPRVPSFSCYMAGDARWTPL